MGMTKYRAFVAVVEYGSLTKAAKAMGYSQPGIGKIISTLEDELNIKLFTKTGTSLTLTDDGKIVFALCKDIIKKEDELFNTVNAVNGLIAGTIKIGALNSLLLDFMPKLLETFSNAYPNIQISLEQFSNGGTIEALRSDTIDIGFTSEFNVKGLEFHPLFKDPCRLIVSRRHALAAYDTISTSALNGCQMIVEPSTGNDAFRAAQNKHKFSPVIRYYVHADAAAQAMVAANLGAYIIPDLQCHNLPSDIKVIEFEEDIYRVMGYGIKSHKSISNAVKELISVAKNLHR